MTIASAIQSLTPGAAQPAPEADLRAAEAVVNAAAAAFAGWSALPPQARADHLVAMADTLDRTRGDLVELAAMEVGASPGWTLFNIDLACACLRQSATLCDRLGDLHTDDPVSGIRSILRRQASGVVLGIAPWNAPVTLAVRALAAPLACGNTVVVKGSEHCPQTHRRLVEILNDAGLPPGVIGIVTNPRDRSREIVGALIAHPAVRRVNFTGSTRVGREVAVQAAQNLKRCLLELSDKAPLIVLEDADLDAAARAAVFGAFFNQGQICMSTERIIVCRDIADAFVARVVALTRALSAADPRKAAAPLGTLINAEAAARVASLIEDAQSKGAHLLTGGEVQGALMQPAVIDHVSSNMRIYHEESFGPVASILRVRDEEEALSIANDTEFGLAAAIFSRDLDRARALADRLETGIVQINGPTVHDDPGQPFGGMKSSGYGRFGGTAVIDEFTETRWIALHDGAIPSLHDQPGSKPGSH